MGNSVAERFRQAEKVRKAAARQSAKPNMITVCAAPIKVTDSMSPRNWDNRPSIADSGYHDGRCEGLGGKKRQKRLDRHGLSKRNPVESNGRTLTGGKKSFAVDKSVMTEKELEQYHAEVKRGRAERDNYPDHWAILSQNAVLVVVDNAAELDAEEEIEMTALGLKWETVRESVYSRNDARLNPIGEKTLIGFRDVRVKVKIGQ